MGFLDILKGEKVPQEAPCPRCGTPAPQAANECSACGWDLHAAYQGKFIGSHVGESGDVSRP